MKEIDNTLYHLKHTAGLLADTANRAVDLLHLLVRDVEALHKEHGVLPCVPASCDNARQWLEDRGVEI